ncbi:MAG TPA: hypothetical protein VGC21_20205 [Telluria sp.]|jgi:hypothetical protein
MDETEDIIDERAIAARATLEKMRLQRAFGDNVAQRFLMLRGIVGDIMQEQVLERYAAKQALRITRDALALAAAQTAPPRFQRSPAPAMPETAAPPSGLPQV